MPRGRIRENFPALTGLRFLLASWVILHHLTGKNTMLEAWVGTLPVYLQNVIHNGYLAVGTFFVLSGFVLARSYSSTAWNRASLIRYGVARIARVYPIYVLSLLLIVPFMFEDLISPGRVAADGTRKVFLLANYGLVLQGWTGRLSVNWNTPAWSLSCEIFFYLCFPAAVFLLARTGRAGMLVAGALAVAAPLWYRWASIPAVWKPVVHFADFLAGMASAQVYSWLKQRRFVGRGYWCYVPACAAALAVIASRVSAWQQFDLNSMLRPANAALLVGLALGGGLPIRALSARVAVSLGQASYSMYILHVPLLWWYKRLWVCTSGRFPRTLTAAVYYVCVIAASRVTYTFIEEPASRRLRAWAANRF
jgi:peptidoglycan/LPS O-acetylase OafA/YrhL